MHKRHSRKGGRPAGSRVSHAPAVRETFSLYARHDDAIDARVDSGEFSNRSVAIRAMIEFYEEHHGSNQMAQDLESAV